MIVKLMLQRASLTRKSSLDVIRVTALLELFDISHAHFVLVSLIILCLEL